MDMQTRMLHIYTAHLFLGQGGDRLGKDDRALTAVDVKVWVPCSGILGSAWQPRLSSIVGGPSTMLLLETPGDMNNEEWR